MHRGPRGSTPRRARLLGLRLVTAGLVSAGVVGTGLVGAGLVGAGLLAGCGGQQTPQPAQQPSTSPPTTAPLPPLPLPRPPEGPSPPEPGLDAADRARLIEARRVGAQWVTLLVTTEPDRTAEVAAGLEQLGGVVGTSSPGEDYLRLTMPTGQVERAATVPGITALDIEQVISPQPPRPTG